MSTPMHDEVERIQAEYEERKRAIAGLQQSLGSQATTVQSKNRELSVTMDANGQVTEVKFLSGRYRSMSGAELGALVVDTIRQARRQCLESVAAAYRTVLPAGLPLMDVLNGSTDIERLMDEWFDAAGAEGSPS
ncbi:MAG TPA: YbaB/EbfC family nucleoid-associated protein [Rugosimonospora sp.]|nr:YbaB/EbfC family nucleoid-associated protein [Rugosimonospora sp.]